MSFLGNMRLSTRIYIQQGLLVLALIGVSVFALVGVTRIAGEAHLIQSINLPMAQAMADAASQRLRQNRAFERILRHGPDIRQSEVARDHFETVVRQFHEHDDSVLKHLGEAREWLQKSLAKETEDNDFVHMKSLQEVRATMDEITRQQKAFRQAADGVVVDFNEGRVERAVAQGDRLEDTINANNEVVEVFLREVHELQSNPIANINSTTDNLDASLLTAVLLLSVLAVIMIVYTGFTLRDLRKSMGNIGNSVQQVASAASQSSNAISVVADGSKQQSEAISQAVTAVSQSAAVLADVSRSAEGASDLSKQTAGTVSDGREQMTKMAEVVNRIAENSGKINKITEVINTIASQTNMLSLNAAIEAARAGEHGKGFAVVAEQVRKLAESSRNSVQDIVELAQQAARDANEAVLAADRVNVEMGKIHSAAAETEQMMQSIATAMEEQVATVEELQHNMDTLKSIGNNNANAAEEITQTILELSHIADDTNNEVRKFNI